jgi:hypothetical protein
MKHLRHFCIATILTFTLAFSAFAGDIHCGVVSDPPSQQSAAAGDMATEPSAADETSGTETAYVDPVTGLALDLLQSLLSLF